MKICIVGIGYWGPKILNTILNIMMLKLYIVDKSKKRLDSLKKI